MKPDPESVRKILLNAQQAIQRGDRLAARHWAERAVALDPDSEEPWLYLAAFASPRASVNYLERALKINPHNQRAIKGMQWAMERLRRERVKQLLKQATPLSRDLLEGPGSDRATQPGSSKTAAAEPKPSLYMQKLPAQPVGRLTPMADLPKPKTIVGSRWFKSLIRFSSRWQNWIGVALVSLFILVAIAAPLISPNDPKSPGAFMKVPGFRVTDLQPYPPKIVPPLGSLPGQTDVFHALIWGTREALEFGLEVAILAALTGILFGAIAGYIGGVFNNLLMRITDAFLAFPVIAGVVLLNQLWLAAMIAQGGLWDRFNKVWFLEPVGSPSPILVLFQSINPLVLILILFSWMPYARITNAIVITLKNVEFIQAARIIGARPSRIILRHLIPNSIGPAIVLAARDVGSMVILQAAFTFIGLDGSSIWGSILVMGRDWILGPGGGILAYWWVYVPATLALVLFGIGWNLLGDGLGELLDPRDN